MGESNKPDIAMLSRDESKEIEDWSKQGNYESDLTMSDTSLRSDKGYTRMTSILRG